MEFYTAFSEKRPVRLSENTRQFAYDSLQGRYGDDTMATPYIELDQIDGFGELSLQEQYNIAIMKIAEEAPLRICEHESVSGAATLGEAIHHVVPAFFKGKPICSSVSHLTIDFQTVIFKGIDYLEQKIQQEFTKNVSDEKKNS